MCAALATSEVRPVVLDPAAPRAGGSLHASSIPLGPVDAGDLPELLAPTQQAACAASAPTPGGGGGAAAAAARGGGAKPSAGRAGPRKRQGATAVGAGGSAEPGAGAGAGAGEGTGTNTCAAGGGEGVRAAPSLLSSHGFRPEFARPPPPLLAFDEQELMWLTPTEATPLLWDDGMLQDASTGSVVARELIAKACASALQASQQRVR